LLEKIVNNALKFGKAALDQLNVKAIVVLKNLGLMFYFANGFSIKLIILLWLIIYHTMVFS
jgi:hypothetical protein